jgi:hypothetical protein
MYVIGISLIGLSFLIRAVKFRKFLKSITKVCHIYDWKCVDENGDLLLEIIEDEYWKEAEWSAYNFLYLKGPSPFKMFFSFKALELKSFYEEKIIEKVKKKVVK